MPLSSESFIPALKSGSFGEKPGRLLIFYYRRQSSYPGSCIPKILRRTSYYLRRRSRTRSNLDGIRVGVGTRSKVRVNFGSTVKSERDWEVGGLVIGPPRR